MSEEVTGSNAIPTLQTYASGVFTPMQMGDLDVLMPVEERVHSHPWTRGNFVDSLSQGYTGQLLHHAKGHLVGYFLFMTIVDEAHLLDIAVDVPYQSQGFGGIILRQLTAVARAMGMQSLLLEVRVSNARAIGLYAQGGFSEIGRRKNYYPAADNTREDAIVMQLPL